VYCGNECDNCKQNEMKVMKNYLGDVMNRLLNLYSTIKDYFSWLAKTGLITES
jgi:hypothetical protein